MFTPNGVVHLRMHHMFLHAPPPVRRAIGVWLRSRRAKKAAATVDEFIKAHKHLVREKKPRAVRIYTQGRFHDLSEIYEEVNARFFNGAIDAQITWGRMPGRRPRRSIRFGSYSTEDNLIRMHPLLDQDFVPRYFVKYIVFHEMLHAFLGVEECENGRRAIHPPKFKRLEAQYPEYERAVAWMNRPSNLRRILGSRKRRR